MADSEFKERIRRELPIDSYIGRFVNLKKTGKSYIGLCPFHGEKTPSFHVNSEGGYYHCFGCKASGDIFRFVMDYHKVDFPKSMEILSDHSGIPLDKVSSPQKREIDRKKEEAYRINQKVLNYYKNTLFGSEGKQALQYLEKRGLSQEEIKQFDIGYAPEGFQNVKGNLLSGEWEESIGIELGILKRNETGHIYDFYRNRIMFPIIDSKGRVIGYSGRTLSQDSREAKYINSPNSLIYDKSSQVYNLYLAQEEIRNTRVVYVVEGVMDAIGLYTRGIRNVIAPLGTSFTEKQARLLKNLSDTVVLVMDGDSAGQKGAQRASEILLREGAESKVVLVEPGKDPFELSRALQRQEIRKILDTGESSWQFLVQSAIHGVHTHSSPEEKKRAIQSLFDFTRRWDKETDRQIFLGEGSKRLGIPLESILQDFRGGREQFRPKNSDTRTVRNVPPSATKSGWNTSLDFRPIKRGAMECERSLLAKLVHHPALMKWAQRIDELEFLDPVSVVMWEWLFTQFHMGEPIHPAEVLSSDSLPLEVREGFAPFLMQEESSETEDDLNEVFEELIMRQEIFYHESEMDNLILTLGNEIDNIERLTLVAKHKDEVQKRKEYLRNKALVRS